jgi:peptidoglycan/LPS O-acetylase OafA/YrhL
VIVNDPSIRAGLRSAKAGYHPGLDGLRAIAVMTVVLFHARSSFFPGGYIGVDIFFVLSGYLISSLLLTEWNRAGRISLKEFYIRRSLRLLPALVVLCAAVLVVLWANPGIPERRETFTGELTAISYSSAPVAALGGHLGWMLPTWSLSVEEYFYVIWPAAIIALCILTGRKHGTGGPLKTWMVTFAVLAASYRFFAGVRGWGIERIAYAPDTRAEQLLIGATLAVILPALSTTVRTVIALLSGGLLAAFVLAPASLSSDFYRYGGSTLIAVMSAAVIAHVVQRPQGSASRYLASSSLVWIGRRSYGIYLWNLPIVGFVAATAIPGPLQAPTKVLLTLLIPALSYALVETPFLNLKSRYRTRSATPEAAPDRLAASPVLRVIDP